MRYQTTGLYFELSAINFSAQCECQRKYNPACRFGRKGKKGLSGIIVRLSTSFLPENP